MRRSTALLPITMAFLISCGGQTSVDNDKRGVSAEAVGPNCPSWGWFCGSSLGGNATHLYWCAKGASTSVDLGPCADNRCLPQSSGLADFCDGGSAGVAPPASIPGNGWWCGQSFGGTKDHLYYFDTKEPADLGLCPTGCHVAASGVPDSCNPAAAGNINLLYPNPRYAFGSGQGPAVHTVCVDTSALPAHAHLDALVAGAVKEAGLTVASSCDYAISFVSKPPVLDSAAESIWSGAGNTPNRYIVQTQASGAKAQAIAYASDEAGALYAARAALALTGGGKMTYAVVVDYPSLPLNGVVEGIYGSPPSWSVSDRTTVIRLMSRLRENTFIYSPKGDAYTRNSWRTPYDAYWGDIVGGAAHEADADLVTFYWGISPGLDYGFNAADFNALTAKLENVRALGVRRFALFLDDIPMPNGFDYATGVRHAQLINAVDDYLKSKDPTHHLITVGTNYAVAPTAYSDGMGATLHAGVDVMWTGNAVEPSTMSAGDMNAINKSLRRHVSIWDNWPNQAGSFNGRSGDLHTNVSSYFTNPVLNEQPGPWLPTLEFLKVLGPIADYLADSERYSAGASFNAWQPRLTAAMKIVQPLPGCGNVPSGFTCADSKHIFYCDAKGLTTLPCPGGCQSEPAGSADLCH